jgi:hypothetical protein
VIDGVTVSVGDRVLVKDQSSAAENGIYLVASGSWTRATDADAWTELVSAFVFVESGTANGNNGYTCTVAAGGTLGSTAVTWVQFSGAGQITAGAGLTKTGNTLNVGTASSARIVVNADNLDLATSGVTAGNYALVTVDAYGRVTAGSLPTTISGFGITDAYTKTEVNSSLALKLNLTGGTMSGAIAMGTNKITGLGAPTTDNDAVTLKYVSDLYGSTASAASSAAAALVSQNAAAASASAASTSEGNALTYKNAAQASASAASTSETNAAGSAASAAASYDSFDDRYLGPKSTAPAVDNDGNALLVGALYFDTTINSLRVYDGSLWMSAGSSVNGTSRRYKYVATAAQTTFTGVDANGATLAYDPLYLDIFLNGSRLDASDYTATSGSSIVLGVAASANDELNIVCFGTFAVATHVLKSGDTMTGQLTVPTLAVSGGTANGVAYLNGSKVLTTGSALVFDGTNIGLGVTPSASNLSGTLQLKGGTSLYSYATTDTTFGNNVYYNSGQKYIANGYASAFQQYQGAFYFLQASNNVSGAGIAATLNTAMTLDASGNLVLGATSATSGTKLDVNGAIYARTDVYVNATSSNIVDINGSCGMGIVGGASGYLKLSTNNSERARIDSSGNLLVGTTSKLTGGIPGIDINNAAGGITFGVSGASKAFVYTSPSVSRFITESASGYTIAMISGGTAGVVLANGGTSWGSLSDERKKDIIEPITDAANKVSTLRAVIGKYKTDDENTRRSFLIAQDVQTVLPEAVVEENGDLILQYTDVIPLLVAAIQEQQAIIEQLQADVAALKA